MTKPKPGQDDSDDTKTIVTNSLNKIEAISDKMDQLGMEVAASREYKKIFDLSHTNSSLISDNKAEIAINKAGLEIVNNQVEHNKKDISDIRDILKIVNTKMDKFQETVDAIKKAVTDFIKDRSGDLQKAVVWIAGIMIVVVITNSVVNYKMAGNLYKEATDRIIEAQKLEIKNLTDKKNKSSSIVDTVGNKIARN